MSADPALVFERLRAVALEPPPMQEELMQEALTEVSALINELVAERDKWKRERDQLLGRPSIDAHLKLASENQRLREALRKIAERRKQVVRGNPVYAFSEVCEIARRTLEEES